jgi:hypothetical protein
MLSTNMAWLIGQAADERHDEPLAVAVRNATEVGMVVPSILRAELDKGGFKVVDDETTMAAYGFKSTKVLDRVLVTDKGGEVVAMGAASDHAEALLAAMLGWFRENAPAG